MKCITFYVQFYANLLILSKPDDMNLWHLYKNFYVVQNKLIYTYLKKTVK